jgi:hypothetical protein
LFGAKETGVTWAVLIMAVIIAPLVLGGFWLVLRGIAAENEKQARELVARLDCPRCRERALEWRGVVWTEQALYDDREEFREGFVLYCTRCNCQSRFTRGGELHRPIEPA